MRITKSTVETMFENVFPRDEFPNVHLDYYSPSGNPNVWTIFVTKDPQGHSAHSELHTSERMTSREMWYYLRGMRDGASNEQRLTQLLGNPADSLVSMTYTAKALRITTRSLHRYRKADGFPFTEIRKGNRILFPRTEVDAFVDAGKFMWARHGGELVIDSMPPV